MAFTTATVLYTVNGRNQSTRISVPPKRYGLGILKQRPGYVDISWFRMNPDIGGYGSDNFTIMRVPLPKNAGPARLKVGKRILSKAA
ncbi:MAG: hypothetical protein WC948_05890 [Thermovirgaceae bacterium]|jgi:hypothetical protein